MNIHISNLHSMTIRLDRPATEEDLINACKVFSGYTKVTAERIQIGMTDMPDLKTMFKGIQVVRTTGQPKNTIYLETSSHNFLEGEWGGMKAWGA